MSIFTKKTLGVAVAVAISSQSALAALSYSNDFEGLAGDSTIAGFAIGNINVTTGAAWFAGTAAPNSPVSGVNGYSAYIDESNLAGDQGEVQLSVFSDYNPWSPFVAGGVTLQSFVSTDVGAITADMVGNTYAFSFDAKQGNIGEDAASQAEAFVKVLKSSDASYNELANNTFDSDANLTTSWSGNSILLTVDAGMVGELLQLGFNNTATDWAPSGVVYDNLDFSEFSEVPVPAAAWLFGSALLGLAGVSRKRA